MICPICLVECNIPENQRGICKSRIHRNGCIRPVHYGEVRSIMTCMAAAEPLPGLLSEYQWFHVIVPGCTLYCKECRKSRKRPAVRSPENLAEHIQSGIPVDIRGVVFGGGEPLASWEYIRDVARILKSGNQKVIVKTNGFIDISVVDQLAGLVDVYIINIQTLNAARIKDMGGDLAYLRRFIIQARETAGVGLSVSVDDQKIGNTPDIRQFFHWLSRLDRSIPVVVHNCTPCYNKNPERKFENGKLATSPNYLHNVQDIIQSYMSHVRLKRI